MKVIDLHPKHFQNTCGIFFISHYSSTLLYVTFSHFRQTAVGLPCSTQYSITFLIKKQVKYNIVHW